ncbi:MAG: sodium-translocating pyrophosphatase [Firmicutes bacterium]|nr:sodium-translocating pyrophosphatase [Bacillota bacterium]
MEQTILFLAPLGAIAALLFTRYLVAQIQRYDEGPTEVVEIAKAVREGARAYLRRQYKAVAIFFAIMFVILIILSQVGLLGTYVPYAFLTGGFFSALAGYVGMTIATRSSSRTAMAAKDSLNQGLRVAFSSGAVMGLTVVGLGLLHISLWYYLLNAIYASVPQAERIGIITSTLVTSGMGASFMALFARVGGGIFTKAADVGADLVGKVEAGIPEDDPRNPAVIADNVGDNVGDVAGMGADLYESYIGAIVATASLAVGAGLGLSGVALPFGLAAIGVFAAIIGTFFIKTEENASQAALLAALRRGVMVAAVIIVVGSLALTLGLLPDSVMVNGKTLPINAWGIYLSILAGLGAGIVIGLITEYYTSSMYSPTKSISAAGETGPATVIISGLSVGMMSTLYPVLVVSATILLSFFLSGGTAHFTLGLFGIGLAAVGMLSTLGITLATDAYGPVADNAGGIAEMAHLGEEVRRRTDALDALGNTTAATGKGFAIGSAALTALALLAAYSDQVQAIAAKAGITLKIDYSIMNPPVLIGLFIGAVLPYVFGSMTMKAVGRAAQSIVVEVRRQFREIAGLMEGKAKPDYANCVDICTKSALGEMVAPSLLAVVAPVVVGLILGVNAVQGLLAGATVSGFLLAVMMSNAGGAWDNAKKYVEEGNYGGKGSETHKATVVGDTVGDPFKDTSGPSLNILIKLLSMVSLVFAALVINFSLLG